jgi:hypothetical protein
MSSEVSHGRGGAGNIGVDETKYVDGSIVRSGPEGSHGDGAYSAGRGGTSLLFASFVFPFLGPQNTVCDKVKLTVCSRRRRQHW